MRAFLLCLLALLVTAASARYQEKNLKWKGPKAVADIDYVRFSPNTPLTRYANSIIEVKARNLLAMFKKEAKAPMTSSGIDMSVGCVVHTDLPNLISVHFSIDSYLGGAHPNVEFATYTFGIVDGKPATLKLKDVASDRREMLSLLTKAIRQELKDSDIDPSAFSPEDAGFASESFVVSKSEIEFLYDGFGHAIGARTGSVKWNSIRSLKRNGPLAALFRAHK